MKNKFLFLIFLFISINFQLLALGAKDEDVKKTQNDEWILCITNINVNSLSQEKRIITDVVLKELVDRINTVSYRTRISAEYTYYEGYAWAGARSAAAKALVTKMEERSRLIFQGNPGWMYRQNLKKIDGDITKLKDNLEKIENNAPLINRHPVFKLTSGNLTNNFPASPAAGTESRFCLNQKADAFLKSEIIDFHGRYLLSVKLFTVYTRSFVWEDSVIFSHDDLDIALEEITRRLIVVLSGNEPASVSITAEPEETLILINRSFAGRGNVEINETSPGTITITASAPEYESLSIETEINPDELISLNFKLNPIRYTDVNINGGSEGRLYHGALYVGNSPLTMSLPADKLEFFEFEANNSNRGTIVFQTPQLSDVLSDVTMSSRKPLPKGHVDIERKAYYWAWGGTWITGITAWVTYHSYTELNKVYQNVRTSNEFASRTETMLYVSTGAIIAVGAVAAYSIYRLVKYLSASNWPATSVGVPVRSSGDQGAMKFEFENTDDALEDEKQGENASSGAVLER